jgi:hypothetical protein
MKNTSSLILSALLLAGPSLAFACGGACGSKAQKTADHASVQTAQAVPAVAVESATPVTAVPAVDQNMAHCPYSGMTGTANSQCPAIGGSCSAEGAMKTSAEAPATAVPVAATVDASKNGSVAPNCPAPCDHCKGAAGAMNQAAPTPTPDAAKKAS